MDTGERLAAYLAGDLHADEARRLEGELARDPSLRDRLARLRRLEEALSELPPIEVPAAFSERLHRTIQDELDGRPVAGDELAARRRRRGWADLPGWLPAAAGAAAVLVAVVAVGVSLSTVGSGDEAAEGGADSTAMQADGAEEEAAGAARTAFPEGPVVVSDGRAYSADEVQALAGEGDLGEVAGRSLSTKEAADLADRYRAALETAGSDADAMAESDGAQDGGTDDAGTDEGRPTESADQPAGAASLRTEGREPVSSEDLAAVRACLDEVLSGEGTLIPVYAELARFDGTDAVVYGLVARDPATDRFTRSELWVVARGSCEVLFFAQRDAAD